jgi:serine/threonine protein kinase
MRLVHLSTVVSSLAYANLECRDKKYVALKVYIHNSMFHRELPFYEHITPYISSSSHVGRKNIRKFHESFTVTGPDGTHIVLVMEPGHIGLYDFQRGMPNQRLPEEMVKAILVEVLQALDFLHTECEAIHAGITIHISQPRSAFVLISTQISILVTY